MNLWASTASLYPLQEHPHPHFHGAVTWEPANQTHLDGFSNARGNDHAHVEAPEQDVPWRHLQPAQKAARLVQLQHSRVDKHF